MFDIDFRTILIIIGRTGLVYLVVLLGIRLFGKREVGQMTPFDLVLLLLLANAVQNAMTGPDTSVPGGLAAALTLLLFNFIITRLVWRNRKLRHFVEGTPTLLIRQGTILKQNLANEKLPIEALHQALREHGVTSIADVALAVLEVDGSVSVLKTDELPAITRPHHRIRYIQRNSA